MESSGFLGYRRASGRVGVRNHVLVMPSVVCVNTVAQKIAAQVRGAVAIPHQHGCAQIGPDRDHTLRIMAGFAANPNVAGVLVVGLGCEGVEAPRLAEEIERAGQRVRLCLVQEEGGTPKTVARGVALTRELARQAAQIARVPLPLAELTLGVVLGETEGVGSAALGEALGYVLGVVVEEGGAVLLAGPDNMPSSKGIRLLAAETPVLAHGQRPKGPGLATLDGGGSELEMVTGLVACGAQVVCSVSARPGLAGCPAAPLLRVAAASCSLSAFREALDLDASGVQGPQGSEALGRRLLAVLVATASGRLTRAERLGCAEFAPSRIGPST